MPDIKLSQVMAFSSEDPSFPANNLLCSESYKKWKSKSAGEKEVSVLLKFENSCQIEAVHIGNEGSAFVEILVGKLGEDVRDFQVLLPTSSFMSPAESRSSTNLARVRMFERDKLSAAALDRPWDCARVVCTQPFCRTAAYGLSFVRFRRADPAQTGNDQQQPQPVRLGSFTLRPESEDKIRAGGLFNRRTELASAGGGALKREDRSDRVVPPRQPPSAGAAGSSAASDPPPPRPAGHYQLKPETKQRRADTKPSDTGKASIASPSASAAGTSRPNSAQRPENAQNRSETTPKRPPAAPKKTDVTPKRPDTTPKRDQKAAPRGRDSASSAPTSNGASGSGDAGTASRPPPNAIYRPLKKLLSGVVFAMSGYQNPRRSELREQGIKLGASYRPDWGPGCTHLICAFCNTPKFSSVRGRGKIVRGEWLTACVKQKRRLSWRRFATDPVDGRQPDSGDELWAEELRPPPPPGSGAPRPSSSVATAATGGNDDDEYGSSTEDEEEIDTDDEIRMAQEGITKASTGSAASTKPAAGQNSSGTSAEKVRSNGPQSTPASTPSGSGTRSCPAPSPSVSGVKRGSTSPVSAAKRTPPEPRRAPSPANSDDAYDAETDEDDESGAPTPATGTADRRPDTADLQVPELPDFLRGRTFLLYGDVMSSETRRQAARAVTAFGGKLEQYFGDTIKYVITEDAWDGNFDDASADHPELMFVRPAWLQACAKRGKFVALQPYLIAPTV